MRKTAVMIVSMLFLAIFALSALSESPPMMSTQTAGFPPSPGQTPTPTASPTATPSAKPSAMYSPTAPPVVNIISPTSTPSPTAATTVTPAPAQTATPLPTSLPTAVPAATAGETAAPTVEGSGGISTGTLVIALELIVIALICGYFIGKRKI